MFVKVSGWVVARNCGVVLMFWELVGDRMMFVRDEFFLSYGHMFYKVVFDNFFVVLYLVG